MGSLCEKQGLHLRNVMLPFQLMALSYIPQSHNSNHVATSDLHLLGECLNVLYAFYG